MKIQKKEISEDKIENENSNEDSQLNENNQNDENKDHAARRLELENAELKGKVEAFQTIAKSTEKSNSTASKDEETWKNAALNDINILSDEEFIAKYKNNKMQVNTALLQYDFQKQTASQRQQISELRAENRMTAKYSNFSEYKDQIQEAMNDAAPEVKQDPERLTKVMERAYLAALNNPSTKNKEVPMDRRSIQTTNFEKPRAHVDKKQENSDEIPVEYAPICNAFGIRSEKERQQYLNTDEIETQFGNGYVLRDSKKGFEKVA